MTTELIYSLLGFMQGILVGVLCILAMHIFGNRKYDQPYHKMAASAMLGWALMALLAVVRRMFPAFGQVIDSDAMQLINMCMVSLLTGMVYSLLKQHGNLRAMVLWSQLPYIVLLVLYLITGMHLFKVIGTVLLLALFAVFMVWALFVEYFFSRTLENVYADNEFRGVSWLRILLWMVLGMFIIFAVCSFVSSNLLLVVYPILSICFWAFIYQCIIHQKPSDTALLEMMARTQVADDEILMPSASEQLTEADKEYIAARAEEKTASAPVSAESPSAAPSAQAPSPSAEPSSTAPAADPIYARLCALMEEEHMYLDADINIGMLADKLGMKAPNLSAYLNGTLRKNFASFINGYRLRDAEIKLRETDDKLEFIAYDCGFNSLRAFRRVFEQYYGMSPLEFRAGK